MKERITKHRERLLEEVDQYEAILKVAENKREHIFGLLLTDKELEAQIDIHRDEINECTQLEMHCDCENLSMEDLQEIFDRFRCVRHHIKHSLRRDRRDCIEA